MKTMTLFHLVAIVSLLLLAPPSAAAAQPASKEIPKAITVDIKNFQPASEVEKKQIEEWLLDIELVPMMADRVAFAATGTIFMVGTSKKSGPPCYCHYAIGWGLDNRNDQERLMVVNQSLLKPEIVEDDKWRLMQSDTSQIDQLRLKSTYHERDGSNAYEPGPKSRVQGSFERANTFFPTRAAIDNPTSAWSGKALDRSKPTVKVEQMVGFQRIGEHSVALFEFVPADFYRYYRGISFRDGVPVQCDDWRQFRNVQDIEIKSPTPEQIASERKRLIATALHVARIQSKWTKIGKQAVPIWIHGVTMNDFHDVQLEAEIQWFINDQVNAHTFLVESLGSIGPFQVSRP